MPFITEEIWQAIYDGKYDLEAMGARGREWVEREADRSVAVRRYRELLLELAS